MAKKNFKSGIDGLLQPSVPKKKRTDKEKIKSDSDHVKATYYLDTQTLNQIKAIAYYEREAIGHVVNEALKKYALRYKNMDEAVKLFKD
jgi:hypothetical protein